MIDSLYNASFLILQMYLFLLTGQPLQLAQSSVMPMGQNVMVNQGQDEEDKGTIKPSESDFNITPQDPVLTMVEKNDEISGINKNG